MNWCWSFTVIGICDIAQEALAQFSSASGIHCDFEFHRRKRKMGGSMREPKFFIYEQYVFLLDCSVDYGSKIGSRGRTYHDRYSNNVLGVFLNNHHDVSCQVLKGTCDMSIKVSLLTGSDFYGHQQKKIYSIESKYTLCFMSGECRSLYAEIIDSFATDDPGTLGYTSSYAS